MATVLHELASNGKKGRWVGRCRSNSALWGRHSPLIPKGKPFSGRRHVSWACEACLAYRRREASSYP
jgi:hypothetical protein